MQHYNINLLLYIAGPKHRQRFLCEVKVDGQSYVGAGNSTTKKEAQMNAARDFVNYLVRAGLVAPADVPGDIVVKPDPEVIKKTMEQEHQTRSVFQVVSYIAILGIKLTWEDFLNFSFFLNSVKKHNLKIRNNV